ncbi:hypothetical protein OAE74_01255 [Verrucomicrobia bacterium]|nr:hypothetical protein [Verrucomicrobiota bacterium]
MNDFVLPYFDAELGFEVAKTRFDINGSKFNMERHLKRHAVDEYSKNHPNAQETLLFKTFADLVLSGKRDSHWPEIALKTQRVMEACFKSAHNNYIMAEP